ncbi:FTR1 family protein [uncultured Rhodoblastus sp.]|uniref:FTR1 family iron permease n=1 Tax=uncultured Rhodoblastus sp. TaxID=543037 RepID=UPI0025DA500C|nr:FTR1 family protein [uncultured Rhodoblastus sp.]
MIGALIIVFREVIEAGLIIGIVLAVTRGVPHRGAWVFGGVASGVLGACLVAAFAGALSNAFAGVGQELFNAFVLALAVVMLGWHNIWMARHGRELANELRVVGQSVVQGSRSLMALAIVIAVAVLREGSEVALFLYGLAASGGSSSASMLLGGALGLALGGGVSALMFFGLVTIPTRHLFSVTSALITFLAAGMASQCVAFLQQAGLLNAFSATLWDTSAILPEESLPGRALHALFGYTDQPSGMQLIVYLAVLLTIFALTRMTGAPAAAVQRVGGVSGA